jgi:hypothetical protein
MYTEEFEGLEEEEKGPRTYVSNVSNFSQQDAERLARENEKLRKNLEKEKFFNKLLDQEIKEVKAESSSRYPADFRSRTGVSKGAFYTLLVLALAMAGYIFYTLYNNRENNPLDSSSSFVAPEEQDATEPAQDVTSSGETPATTDQATATSNVPPVTIPPAVKDSVPNIIGNNKGTAAAKKTVEAKKKPVAVAPAPKEEEYNEAEVEAALKEESTTTNTKKTVTPPPAVEQQPPVQQPSRPVIARYKVTSKANFYNGPDENTLRSAFISAGPNKVVDALDDKNGFIYVEYVNDHGMLSKGWLSKTDLTKSE